MKPYILLCLSFWGVVFIKAAALSDSNSSVPSISPTVELPSGLARLLFEGSADNPKGHINCYVVLYGMPGFQNAQAQGACYEAQTACLRLGLLQQFLQSKKNRDFSQLYPGTAFATETITEVLKTSLHDVKLKLLGCAVATAASVISDSVIDQAGFLSPVEMEQYKNSSLEPTLPRVEDSPSSDPISESLAPLPE